MKRSEEQQAVRKAVASLEAELAHLRTVLREVGETFVANLEAEIVQLGSSVAEMQDSLKDDRQVSQMVAEIRSLNVKPGKGRRKDFKKIDELVDRLEAILHEME